MDNVRPMPTHEVVFALKAEIHLLQYHQEECRRKVSRYLRDYGLGGLSGRLSRDMSLDGIQLPEKHQAALLPFLRHHAACGAELRAKESRLRFVLGEQEDGDGYYTDLIDLK